MRTVVTAVRRKSTALWAAVLVTVVSLAALVPFVLSQQADATPVAGSYTITGDTAAAENNPGWMFNRDPDNATPVTFMGGNASTGIGALKVEPLSSTDADRKFIGEHFIFTPIADLDAISVDYKLGPATNSNQVYFNVYANFASSAADKYYDCKYDVVASAGSTSAYNTLTFNPDASYTVTTRGSSPHACPSVPSDMETLEPGSTIRMYSINLGDTSLNDAGMTAYFDNAVVQTTAGAAVYNFEPVPTAAPANVRLNRDSTGGLIASGSAVSYTDVTMRWDTVPNASKYQVQVTDPTPATQANRYTGWYTFDLSDSSRFGFFGDQQGEWKYQVRALDATTGVWSNWTTEVILTYDTLAPVVQNLSLDRTPTNANTVTVSGEISDPTLKEYKYQIVNSAKQNVLGEYSWSKVGGTASMNGVLFTAQLTGLRLDGTNVAPLPDGDYYVRVWADDKAGNRTGISSPIYLLFTIDRVAPDAPILVAPLDGAVQNGGPTQAWSHTNPSDVAYYRYESYSDAGMTSPIYSTTTTNTQRTIGGTQNLILYWRVGAVDAAGNVAWSDLWELTVDNTAPVLAIDTYTVNGNEITPDLTTAETGLTYAWTQTAGPTSADISDLTVLAPTFTVTEDGTYAFQIVATDEAGNTTTRSFSFTYVAPEPTTTTSEGADTGGTPVTTPLVNTPPIVGPGFTAVGVLGATDEATTDATNSDGAVEGASTVDTLAQAVDADNTDGTAMGLAWYWWVVIIGAAAVLIWGVVAAFQRRGNA